MFRKTLYSLLILPVVFLASAFAGSKVVISCGAVGKELELCREGALAWAQKTSNQVEIVAAPNSSGERLAQYQLLLAAGAPDIDVFAIDTTWPGMMSDFLLDLKPYIPASVSQQFFQPFIENNTVQGKWIAVPWFIDAGMLYFRKDLLEQYQEKIPETWEELTATAKKIQKAERAKGRTRLWGYVFSGRAYEGLTCNALEWIYSSGGGSIVDSTGKITINNPSAIQSLDLAASWIHTISPRGVLNYVEEDCRGIFQSGEAIFMRNWPYAWKLTQSKGSAVKGKVGIAPLPRRIGTLGGWSLAVSKYSRNPSASASLIQYLTSAQEQKRRTLSSGLNPTIPALYVDPDLLKENPQLKTFLAAFQNAVSRPSKVTGQKYNRVSEEFWNTVHTTLSGKGDAKANLKKLEKKLMRISRNGNW